MNGIISLAKAYEGYFKIGAAVSYMGADHYEKVLKENFNSITPENEMKYEMVEPEEGKFTFETPDKIFSLARRMGIKVRAHAPVWHNQTGAWMYRDGDKAAAPELIYERIDAHSKAICQRYNNDVYAWDVVNEAVRDLYIDDGGTDEVYRNSEYFMLCGKEFIAKAFQAMDKYSPNAQLFYNDYDECVPEKRKKIVRLIQDIQEKGCRIDGFGMQQHYFRKPDFDELKRSIEEYAGLGIHLHITELDITLRSAYEDLAGKECEVDDDLISAVTNPTNELIDHVGEIYLKLFEIYRSYRDVIDCVTTWGVADDYSWLDFFRPDKKMPRTKQYPMLFNRYHAAKPCVAKLIEAVK